MWTGTDSLMMVDVSKRTFRKKVVWLLFRWIIKFLDKHYVQEHYIDSLNLKDNLVAAGLVKPIKVRPDPVKYQVKLPKIQHEGFNVLYYCPDTDNKFIRWLYGYDIFESVKEHFPTINFIHVDGSQNMKDIYPITDFYLRCNRHDGASRMVQECQIQDIPYYHSQRDPDTDEIIKKIRSVRYAKQVLGSNNGQHNSIQKAEG